MLELMVALTVGGIAITSIYAIGSAATRQFYQQHQVASAQTALRMALNQVKRDIARAGYLSTPNANPAVGPVQTCAPVGAPIDDPAVSGRLAGFSRFADNVTIGTNDAIDPTGNNDASFQADEVVLFGNFETSAEYSNITAITPNQIEVDHDWHAFRRDFLNWNDSAVAASYSFNEAAFDEAFTVGRLIRLQTTNGLRHFARITGVTDPTGGSDVRINFDTAIPAGCLAAVDEGWVSPVNAMRYTVRNATGTEAQRFADTHGLVGQLIREEVLPTTKTQPLLLPNGVTPASRRALLDYLVAFNLAFTMNGATAPGAADNYVPGTTTNVAATVNANPERIRAVSIELAVRTPEQDPSLTWTAAGCANLACFQVFTPGDSAGRPGAARVRRARAEVFAPNVAYEGY